MPILVVGLDGFVGRWRQANILMIMVKTCCSVGLRHGQEEEGQRPWRGISGIDLRADVCLEGPMVLCGDNCIVA
jgi:hypothetical protein